MTKQLDKLELLRNLDPIEPEQLVDGAAEQSQSMSLARALRTVAQLGQEHAHDACRAVAEHVLGRVPEAAPPVEE